MSSDIDALPSQNDFSRLYESFFANYRQKNIMHLIVFDGVYGFVFIYNWLRNDLEIFDLDDTKMQHQCFTTGAEYIQNHVFYLLLALAFFENSMTLLHFFNYVECCNKYNTKLKKKPKGRDETTEEKKLRTDENKATLDNLRPGREEDETDLKMFVIFLKNVALVICYSMIVAAFCYICELFDKQVDIASTKSTSCLNWLSGERTSDLVLGISFFALLGAIQLVEAVIRIGTVVIEKEVEQNDGDKWSMVYFKAKLMAPLDWKNYAQTNTELYSSSMIFYVFFGILVFWWIAWGAIVQHSFTSNLKQYDGFCYDTYEYFYDSQMWLAIFLSVISGLTLVIVLLEHRRKNPLQKTRDCLKKNVCLRKLGANEFTGSLLSKAVLIILLALILVHGHHISQFLSMRHVQAGNTTRGANITNTIQSAMINTSTINSTALNELLVQSFNTSNTSNASNANLINTTALQEQVLQILQHDTILTTIVEYDTLGPLQVQVLNSSCYDVFSKLSKHEFYKLHGEASNFEKFFGWYENYISPAVLLALTLQFMMSVLCRPFLEFINARTPPRVKNDKNNTSNECMPLVTDGSNIHGFNL